MNLDWVYGHICLLLGAGLMYAALSYPSINTSGPREPVVCEFAEPITVVVSVLHWYDSHEELNKDYATWADPNDVEELWGWSNCEWQPENDIAACDIYAVLPLFVNADENMDTLGHEILHGSCGEYHE